VAKYCHTTVSQVIRWIKRGELKAFQIPGDHNRITIKSEKNEISNSRGDGLNVTGSLYSHYDHNIDTSNTIGGKPVYYEKNVSNKIFDRKTNGDAGAFYAINCNNITIKNIIPSNNYAGIYLWNTHNSIIENISAAYSYWGIALDSSNNNTITNNDTSLNDNGIALRNSSCNNIIENNIATNNYFNGIVFYNYNNNNIISNNIVSNDCEMGGIYLSYSNKNTVYENIITKTYNGIVLVGCYYNIIYNNYLIDNEIQAYNTGNNNFFLPLPIGGNYWSDWTSPDANKDHIVDVPYMFNNGGVDKYPWAQENGWKNNSLASKLSNALLKLTQDNENSSENIIEAFINEVEALRGKKLTDEEADELIAAAQDIIAMKSGTAKRVISQDKTKIPVTFSLFQNSPNPFNPVTTIQYSIPAGESKHVTLNVYDLRGALVRTLVDDISNPGYYSIIWNGRDEVGTRVSSGIYLYQLKAGEFTKSNKMILMK